MYIYIYIYVYIYIYYQNYESLKLFFNLSKLITRSTSG